MTEDNEINCPYCGKKNYILIEETSTFTGPVYNYKCLECNKSF